MAKQKLRKKKKEGVMSLGGKIITIFFVILLIGGGYYIYSLFKPIEINAVNMAGEWKLQDGSETSYWNFEPTGIDGMSGTCTYYTYEPNSYNIAEKIVYDFYLELNGNGVMELHCTAKKQNEVVMKVTSLSSSQMNVFYKTSKTCSMVRTHLF